MNHEATAFAPASVGNVAVGYDVLGNALDDLCGASTRPTSGLGPLPDA